MAAKKKTTKAVGAKTSNPKTKKQSDPGFDKLLQQLKGYVNSGKLDRLHTEDFCNDWILKRRKQRFVNYDSSPDFDHLMKLKTWDHYQICEIIFGVVWEGFERIVFLDDQCKPTEGYEMAVLRVIPPPINARFYGQSEKSGYKLEYEWGAEIKAWYMPANHARKKFEDILSRGIGEIPGLIWADGSYWYKPKFFIPWLKHELKILVWLERERCRIPDWLESFLAKWKESSGVSPTHSKKSKLTKPSYLGDEDDKSYAAKMGSKGGKVETHGKGIQAAVNQAIEENPDLSVMQVFNTLSKYDNDSPLTIDGYEVHVDGGKVWQNGAEEKQSRSVTKESLKLYVARAKSPHSPDLPKKNTKN